MGEIPYLESHPSLQRMGGTSLGRGLVRKTPPNFLKRMAMQGREIQKWKLFYATPYMEWETPNILVRGLFLRTHHKRIGNIGDKDLIISIPGGPYSWRETNSLTLWDDVQYVEVGGIE